MLLGCLATNLACAIELGALLTRSAVRVTIHTTVPEFSDADRDEASFQILVLDAESLSAGNNHSTVGQCVDWLLQMQAQRIALIHPRTLCNQQLSRLAAVADDLLSLLQTHGAATLCHCRKQNSHTPMQSALSLPVTPMDQDVIHRGAADIAAALADISATTPIHVLIDCQTDDDYLSSIRGSERITALCGTADLALHLPALFRVRGWLPSKRHVEALTVDDTSLWLETGQAHTQTVQTGGTPVLTLRNDVETSDNRGADIRQWLTTACAAQQEQPIPLRCFTHEPDTWSIATIRLSPCQRRLQLACASLDVNNEWAERLCLGSDYVKPIDRRLAGQ